PKASARRKRSGSDTSITPPTAITTPTVATALRLTAAAKGKQPAKAKDEGTGSKPGVPDVPSDDLEYEISWNSSDDEDVDASDKDKNDDEGNKKDESDDGKEDDDDDEEDSEDEDNGEEDLDLNIGEEERHDDEEEEDELYRDVNINQGRGLQGTLEVKDTHITLTLTPTSVAPLPMTIPSMTSSTIATTTTSQAPILPTPIPSERLNETVKVSIQIQSDRLHKEAQRDNDEFHRTVDENIRKIIKEHVKEQVKAQVSQILPRIEQAVNEQLEAEALVDAYESDKIILDTYRESVTLKRRHDDAGDNDEEPSARPDRGSKRCREGKEPESASTPSKTATKSASRSTTGSRYRQASTSESAFAEEPVQTTSQIEEPSYSEFETGANDQPIVQSSKHHEWFSQPQKQPSPDRDWNKTLPAINGSIQPWISELAKQADTRSSFNELMDTPLDFSNFIMNQLRVDTLTPELLFGLTYDLVKGSCKSLIELEYHLEEVYKATTDQLD
nr:hypothetical protein [Tanacetum cinerariifolium]